MSNLIYHFKKQGGWKLIKEYAQNGVLPYAIGQLLLTGPSKKSLELLRIGVSNKLEDKLRKQYLPVLRKLGSGGVISKPSKRVWVCWLQGIENAPEIVKACYSSLQEHLSDEYTITVVTETNRKDFIHLPDYIEEKYQKGIMSHAHFSDILRVALLAEHGGTWIDATVWLSGKPSSVIMDADFFVFQNLQIDEKNDMVHTRGISNWFISALAGNKIIVAIRELLYQYWRDHDRTINYFFFHQMVSMIKDEWNDDWQKIYPQPNSTPHILQLMLFENYNDQKFNALVNMCKVHKLTYKFSIDSVNRTDTYYQHIILENKSYK